VFTGDVDLTANERLDVPVRSVSLAPVAEVGREVFFARQSGCQVCHSLEPGEEKIGPSLYGVATRAERRVEGLDAETYLWQSIVLPGQYVVDGYPAGQMLPIYRERLSQEELDALIAYLLTLTDDGGKGGS
jgi:mono/diheme cytochrome c family protein